MARQSSDNLARLRREPNKMNSVLAGLSCSRREASEFARSATQDERRVSRDGTADTEQRYRIEYRRQTYDIGRCAWKKWE